MNRNIKSIPALLAMLLVLGASIAVAAPTVIRFSHAVSENTPKGQAARKFQSIVEERLKDKYVVVVYPNSQLFDDDRIFEALLLDDVQLAAPSMSKFSNYSKKLQLFDLPFLFKDMAAVNRFQNSSTGQELLLSLQQRGIIGLGYLHNGLKQMSATKKLVVPTDANGLKFRIMSSDVLEAQFNAVGAEAIKKPFSHVYSLLSAGALDGQENTWSNIYSKEFYTVQPYITESNHGVLDYMVITSVNFWASLPEEDQKVLKAAMDEAIAFGNKISESKAMDARKKVIDSQKTELVTLTQADRNQWIQAMKPVWLKFEDQIGKDLISKAFQSNK